jgi:hypothetical protein
MLSVIRRFVARIAGRSRRRPVAAIASARALRANTNTGRVCLTLLLMLGGCGSIGPAAVPRDRADYLKAIGNSWKEQTLLNIVRMRYGDAPNFLEISSIISSYALQEQFAAGMQLSSNLTPQNPFNLTTLGASATYLDRPTITYAPLSGDKFAKSLLQPFPSSVIFELIQAGYPADYILQMTVHAVNGIHNRSSIDGSARQAQPDFYPLLGALRRLQLNGAISMHLQKKNDRDIGTLVVSNASSPEARDDIQFIENTLHVRPRKGEILLVFSEYPEKDCEVAVMSRSLIEILLDVASGIQVPEEDVLDGQTAASARVPSAPDSHDRPPINILSGTAVPARPFVAIRYQDKWYWISNQDLPSKRAFSFLMMFLSLIETGTTPQGPVVTLPDELIHNGSGPGNPRAPR